MAAGLLLVASCSRTLLVSDTTLPSVNPFLWQASLNVVGNLPLDHTDPVAGIVTTQWYALPVEPTIEYKMVVQVTGPDLRADLLMVQVFKRQITAVPLQPATDQGTPSASPTADQAGNDDEGSGNGDEADTADEADKTTGTVAEESPLLYRQSLPVEVGTIVQVEDTILSEARRLRIRSLEAQK